MKNLIKVASIALILSFTLFGLTNKASAAKLTLYCSVEIDVCEMLEQAYEKAKNYMLISIDNSRKRGYNRNNQQRDTSGALHAEFTRSTENDFVIYATSIGKIYNKKYSEGNW